MANKRKRTALPRLTVLAYSRIELMRFSQAAEEVAGAARTLYTLVGILREQLDRLEKRSGAARKANQTRKGAAANGKTETPVVDNAPTPLLDNITE